MPNNTKNPVKGFKQLACEILDISTRSYSNFTKQKRLIINLLEKYFTKEDLEEFIDKGKIKRYDFINEYSFLYCNCFLEKLLLLKNKDNKHYFYNYFYYFTNFILDYIKNGYLNKENQWKGTNELLFFKNYFLDFCINNQPNANSLNPFNAIDFIYNQDAIKPQYIDLEFNTINLLV